MRLAMIILTDNIDKFKLEFPNIYTLSIHTKLIDLQHEMMLNDKFKVNLCSVLVKRYGIFACSDRWLLTDDILKSYPSCIVKEDNSEKYDIQDYKHYFNKVSSLKNKIFLTHRELQDYISNDLSEIKHSHTMEDFGMINTLKVLKDTGGFIMPNIEESIRNAMKELGIDVDDSDYTEVTTSEEVCGGESVDSYKDFDIFDDVPEDSETVVEDNESSSVVYVKIKDGVVALIFGSDIEFQHKKLNGQYMNILSFKMPDITSDKLQELELIIEDKSKSVKIEKEVKKNNVVKDSIKRTPIVKDDTPSDELNDIEELKRQKHALDLKIKSARSDGDVELVNSLRKQRRSIRNKINSIGG